MVMGGVGMSRTEGGVLLLHGKGGSGRSFRERVAGSTSTLGKHLWLSGGGRRAGWTVTSPDGPVALDGGGFAWWAFPPGVSRSYEADEWIGSPLALERASEAARGCQLAIGFSQGAMLLAVLLSKGLLPDCRAAVLAGAGWPRPYARDLDDFRARGRQPRGGSLVQPQILHVTSASDRINPKDQALRVHACLGGDVLEHAGGHTVPLNGEPAEALARWANLKLAQTD